MSTHPADDPLDVRTPHDPPDDSPARAQQGERTLTRSEERLTAVTRPVPVRTVRLERYQVTETRTVSVDLVHDRVRMISIPVDGQPQVTDDPAGDPAVGDAGWIETDPDGGSWLVLTEERVVVTKEAVPVERIRLSTGRVTVEQVVTGTVRAERIEVDDPTVDPAPDPAAQPTEDPTLDGTGTP